jgi:hydrogenase expression/formation protein HypE
MSQPAWQIGCPVPVSADSERISLAHGEGGRLMRRLIEERILPRIGGNKNATNSPGDAAVLTPIDGQLAFTTDSFVVSPLFFPGGDIGRLAVFGTVNDLVVAGAEPLWISLSLIIEEGLPVAVLERVLDSAAAAAVEAGVRIVTGDTKVVPRGAADGLFLNTSGIGRVIAPAPVGPESLQPGNELIVSGPVGRHGIAILAARENLGLIPPPETDCACLLEPVQYLRDLDLSGGERPAVLAMRDATRGGVTAVLHEWAAACDHTLTVDAASVPTTADVRGAAELLGLDPLHIANEGTMLIAASAGRGQDIVAALSHSLLTREAAVIGQVRSRTVAPVTVIRALGREQPLDEPSGAMLPRIC